MEQNIALLNNRHIFDIMRAVSMRENPTSVIADRKNESYVI